MNDRRLLKITKSQKISFDTRTYDSNFTITNMEINL